MFVEWPIAGRREEVELATAAITRRGGGNGIVISGASGVGKTRLCTEAVAAASHLGHRCYRVSATLSSRDVPLAVFADLDLDVDAQPLRQIRCLLDHLTSPDDRALIVAVDDAHLLDNQSAFVIHELTVRKLANVLVSIRTGEPAPDAIAALWKDRHLPRLELQPLSRAETRRLLERALDGPIESTTLERLYALCDGNVLFLRQLVDEEYAAGRFTNTSGLWFWSGDLTISPTLAETIRANMTNFPPAVSNLVDLLAVSEPLTTTELASLVDDPTLELAESLGAISTRASPTGIITVRLGHPLLGEVRRAELGLLRRRRLATDIANTLSDCECREPSAALRRAVLLTESGLRPDPPLLARASQTALLSLDVNLATRFATCALALDISPEDAYFHLMTLVVSGQGQRAEQTFAEYALESDHPDFTRWNILRAANLVWMLARPAEAAELLDGVDAGSLTPAVRSELCAVRACVLSVQASPREAIREAEASFSGTGAGDFFSMMATAAMVMSVGAVGKCDVATEYANQGFARAQSSWQTALLQFWLAGIHARVCRIAGRIDRCLDEATRFTDIARDMGGTTNIQATFLRGHAALAEGRVQAAIVELLDTRVGIENDTSNPRGLSPACLIWLAEAKAISGEVSSARTTLQLLSDIWPSEYTFMEAGLALANAWTHAVEGAVSHAIKLAIAAADDARQRGQTGYEVMALQTATQFGCLTMADRLGDLTSRVDGPRALIAARHAAALATDDAAGVLAAAGYYERMGDRLAAADTAAQARRIFTSRQRRGSALLASEMSRRLAIECGRTATPAQLQATVAVPFTARQCEIITLAAAGLSNSEIAARLTVSVRSVEGHLYRAAQRAGVNSRDELAQIMTGSQLR